MRHALAITLSFGILAAANTSVGYAQLLPRTWVSSVGNDASACTRAAPCATFAGAIAKTVTHGEINCIDNGGFGAITITKSITIDCNGVVAGIVASADATGVVVNATSTDVVILRNLEINGVGTGRDGVRFVSGNRLIIENTKIFGFQAQGVLVLPMTDGSAGSVVISNSTISTITNGVGTGIGIRTQFGGTVLSHSVVTGNNRWGLLAENTGMISADSNLLTYNGIAAQAGTSGGAGQGAATVRLSNNDVYANGTGFGCGGGVLASTGNNRKGGNVGGGGPVCAPTVPITQQ